MAMYIEKSVGENLALLNENFRKRKLIVDIPVKSSFYEQLESLGLDINNSLIVDIYPDSGSTYIGTIVDQNLQVLLFDIDVDFPEYSKVKKKSKLNKVDKLAIKLARNTD